MEDKLIDKLKVPPSAVVVMDGLARAGFQAYLVGGCVRDMLLGLIPSDYDITTDATPEQVKPLFAKVVPTGEKYGTVTVHGEMDVEVTTFRKDGAYLDGRRPESVSYSKTLLEDASRRDFTINALAIGRDGQVIDLVGGVADLKKRLIRCVGEPKERFTEDALRMLRAIRFECQVDGQVEEHTFDGIKICAPLISNVSMERVRDELCKILTTGRAAEGVRRLEEGGLLQFILPEVHACAEFDRHNGSTGKAVFPHTMDVVRNVPPRPILRLAALLHDIGKPGTYRPEQGYSPDHHILGEELAVRALQRLRFDRRTIDTVAILVKEHMSRYDFLRVKDAREFINRVGVENLDDLFDLQIADIKASRPPHDFSKVEALRAEVAGVLSRKDPLTVKDLAVDGNDLQEWGMRPGAEMGRMLDELLDRVLEAPSLNAKEQLKMLFEDLRASRST